MTHTARTLTEIATDETIISHAILSGITWGITILILVIIAAIIGWIYRATVRKGKETIGYKTKARVNGQEVEVYERDGLYYMDMDGEKKISKNTYKTLLNQ